MEHQSRNGSLHSESILPALDKSPIPISHPWFIRAMAFLAVVIRIQKSMKKRSEATQTLCAGCIKADKQTHKQTGAITIHCAA